MARDADFQRTSLRLLVQIGDLVQRKDTPEWMGIVTGFNNEHYVRIIWLDTGEKDGCNIDLLEPLA